MSAVSTIGRVCGRMLARQFNNARTLTTLPKPSSLLWNHSVRATTVIPSRCLASSKTDSDMVEFLTEEIAAEKQQQKQIQPISDFDVKQEGAELTLTRKIGDEKIVVTLNVNHTVDSAEPDDGSQEAAPEMRSKPSFEVDIVKANGKTLSFSCSYMQDAMSDDQTSTEEHFDDAFTIDEVTMFEGENWSDKSYAVAGDILDGYLYDLFMNMLDERGINKEFSEKLSDYTSAYEHGLYINMLENLQKFVK